MIISMEPPDISHLTKEEQDQILSVIKRQKEEEEKEKAFKKTWNTKVQNYKNEVQQVCQPPTNDTKDKFQICILCNKTKIAEGCGHTCAYCSKSFCSKCGGRVALKSNKMIWVCNVCRKKQEYVTSSESLNKNGKNNSSITLNLEPLPANDNNMISTSASLAQLDQNKRRKTELTASTNLKKGLSVPQLQLENDSLPPKTLPEKNIEAVDKEKIVVTSVPTQIYSKVMHPTKESHDHPTSYVGSTGHESTSAVTLGIRRSSTNSERRLHRQEQAVVSEGASLSISDYKLTQSGASNFSALRSSSTEDHRLAQQPNDVSQQPLFNSLENRSSAPKTNPDRSPVAKHTSTKFSPKSHHEKTTGDANHGRFSDGKEQKQKRDGHSYTQRYEKKDDVSAFQSSIYSQNGDFVPLSSNRAAVHQHLDDADRDLLDSRCNQTHISKEPQSSSSRDKYRTTNTTINEVPHHHRSNRHHHHHHQNHGRSSSYQKYDHFVHTLQPDHTLHPGHTLRPHHSSRPHHVNEKDEFCLDNSFDSYLHQKHRHGYMSDNEGSMYTPQRNITSLTRRQKGSSHSPFHPSDDSASCSCAHHIPKANQGRRGADSIPPCARFCSSDNLVASSQRCSEPDFYHSDVNLSRPLHWRSSAEIARARGPTSYVHHSRMPGHYPRYQHECSAIPRKFKPKAGKPLRRNLSLSSTDDDVRSTPDYSSCDETSRHYQTDRGGNLIVFKSIESGYHSNTSATQSHDKCPVSWQLSCDGKSLIGRMLLNKTATNFPGVTTGPVLGVKVVGGKRTESGYIGAFITRVKKGSIADKVGRLEPGDEVIMWNDNKLRGASFNQVCEVVSASKDDKLISLVVSRSVKDVRRINEHPVTESSSSSFDSQKREDECMVCRGHQNLECGSYKAGIRGNEQISGKIQIRIAYDRSNQQLLVTVVQAVDLLPRPDGLMRTSYVKMYLLPDRSEQSKRRTKTAKKTLDPVWHQTFAYSNVRRRDLNSMSLELSLWDLDRSFETNSHFMGQIFIDLSTSRLDNTPQWYKLMPPDGGVNWVFDSGVRTRSSPISYRPRTTDSSLFPEYNFLTSSYPPVARLPKTSATTSNFRSLSNDEPAELRHHNQFNPVIIPKESRRLHSDQTTAIDRHETRTEEGRAHLSLPSNNSPNQRPPPGSKMGEKFHHDDAKREQLISSERRTDRIVATSSKQSLPTLSKERFSQTTSVTESTPRTSCESSASQRRAEPAANLPNKFEKDFSKSSSLGSDLQTLNKSATGSPKGGSRPTKSKASSNRINVTPPARRSNPIGSKITSLVGMKHRSQSSNTLESGKCNRSSRCSEFGIHPDFQNEEKRNFTTGSLASLGSEGFAYADVPLHDFVGKLGPGQLVSRQMLGSSPHGEICISLQTEMQCLKVYIFKARIFKRKPNSKVNPAISVKIYVMNGAKDILKKKTKSVTKSMEPTFDETIVFNLNSYVDTLEINLLGDYGLMDQSFFMGMVKIDLNSLDLSSKLTGWYTLYSRASLAEVSSRAAPRVSSSTNSLEADVTNRRS